MIGAEHFKDSELWCKILVSYKICSSKLKVSFVNKSFINIKKMLGAIYGFVTENAFCLVFNALNLHEETKRTI